MVAREVVIPFWERGGIEKRCRRGEDLLSTGQIYPPGPTVYIPSRELREHTECARALSRAANTARTSLNLTSLRSELGLRILVSLQSIHNGDPAEISRARETARSPCSLLGTVQRAGNISRWGEPVPCYCFYSTSRVFVVKDLYTTYQ